jgi:hypothetical protein
MEFTEHEISVLKGLADEETLALLAKVFVDMPSANFAGLDKNIVALPDAEYGQLMKVKYLTRKDNESRIDFIKSITKEKREGKAGVIAPK